MMTSALTFVVPSDTDRLLYCMGELHVWLANGSSSVASGKRARQQLHLDMQQVSSMSLGPHCMALCLLLQLWDRLMLVLLGACGTGWLMLHVAWHMVTVVCELAPHREMLSPAQVAMVRWMVLHLATPKGGRGQASLW